MRAAVVWNSKENPRFTLQSASPARFRALLVDLDGVVRLWPSHEDELESRCGLPPGTLRKTAFEPVLVRKVITGQIPDEVWRQTVITKLLEAFPASQAQEAVSQWSANSGVVNQPVLDALREARTYLRIALVTNATSKLVSDLKVLDVVTEFDAIVNSSVVGAAKPDAQIYRAALAAVRVKPREALFVDDTRANVEAAQRLGLRAHRFEDVSGLSKFLSENRFGAAELIADC